MTKDEFKATRNEWKLTQAEAADLLGVHKLTVAAWEQGRQAIPHTVALLVSSLHTLALQVQTRLASKQ